MACQLLHYWHMLHALTFVWLALWIAAQLLCFRSRAIIGRHHAYWRTALLVSCLVIVLFPVVSSDDDAAWASQIQRDFDLAGVTQATRVWSRYDLLADLVPASLTQASMWLPVALNISWRAWQEPHRELISCCLHSELVLRGPPCAA